MKTCYLLYSLLFSLSYYGRNSALVFLQRKTIHRCHEIFQKSTSNVCLFFSSICFLYCGSFYVLVVEISPKCSSGTSDVQPANRTHIAFKVSYENCFLFVFNLNATKLIAYEKRRSILKCDTFFP